MPKEDPGCGATACRITVLDISLCSSGRCEPFDIPDIPGCNHEDDCQVMTRAKALSSAAPFAVDRGETFF